MNKSMSMIALVVTSVMPQSLSIARTGIYAPCWLLHLPKQKAARFESYSLSCQFADRRRLEFNRRATGF
jgi:hypothetical protein